MLSDRSFLPFVVFFSPFLFLKNVTLLGVELPSGRDARFDFMCQHFPDLLHFTDTFLRRLGVHRNGTAMYLSSESL